MDIQNHFYGHSAILAAHAGLRAPRHIPGLYQHGWTHVSPVGTHFAALASRAPRGGLFVWTHNSRGWSEERSHVETGFSTVPIGSAALYLARAAEAEGVRPPTTLGTVVIPFHGTRLLSVEGDQEGYAREVLEREGPSVVCLHVDDMRRPDIVSAWKDAGHTLTTAGERRDPAFLGRVMWLLMSAEKVVSNRLATALVYAAGVGTPISIYGPAFRVSGAAESTADAYMRDLWPEFYAEAPHTGLLRGIAERELGADYLRGPEELRTVLGWDRPTVKPFLDYWLGAPAAKALAVLRPDDAPAASNTEEVKASPLHFLKDPLEHLPDPLPRSASTALTAPQLGIRV
ncbi:hypothetical protein [Sinomonas halotolerans]|uniref:Uncharacterized protein n=1 Tax=Sinomonas halotolerans TaxID=1644133 RepID=A0ABU9WWS7_9MICC